MSGFQLVTLVKLIVVSMRSYLLIRIMLTLEINYCIDLMIKYNNYEANTENSNHIVSF